MSDRNIGRYTVLLILAQFPTIFDMVQMNVSVPEALKAWAEARVAEGRYSSTSDYVRDLMRRDQERAEKIAALQAAIDEGRASGVSERSVSDIIADSRRQAGLD
ncbi:MAG: type II toxin-antitoxin system ParD family antitoxin [Sphingomonadaceae bacterium]